MSKILVIAGMHRSGTSLTASWLADNGLFIGSNLMSDRFDNIKGHFEDLDILKIHEQNLKNAGYDTTGLHLDVEDKFELDYLAKSKIKGLIKSRTNYKVWGWKEPRGTLFIEDWHTLHPDLFCFSIYRSYNEVVDSLHRRYRYKLFKTKTIKMPNRILKIILYWFTKNKRQKQYLTAWIKYNQIILEFKKKHPEKCLIINIENLIAHSDQVLENLKAHLALNHKGKLLSSMFEKELFHKNIRPYKTNKSLDQLANETLSLLDQY